MPDEYSEYQNLDSRPPYGDSEGEIEMDAAADGFAYRKRVLRLASVPFGQIQQTLTGQWEILVTDGPNGRVLFHQIVTFRILCVFFIGGVTFIPLDNGGKFETPICDGQQVSKDASGHPEGWRFVDTPRPTPFSEFGTPIFKPNSGNTINGILIDVEWRSPRYKMSLAPGVVFKVVRDEWRQGTDIPIAFYETSVKAGAPHVDVHIDPYGEMWHARSKDGILRVATAFGPYRDLRTSGYLGQGTQASINSAPTGTVWVLTKEDDGWYEYSSDDGGVTWHQAGKLFDRTANMARALITDDGRRISMALDGNDLIFKTSDDGGVAATKIGTVERRQPFAPAIDRHGNIYAVGEDGVEYSSYTGGDGGWGEKV
jgi:hypothetical protein